MRKLSRCWAASTGESTATSRTSNTSIESEETHTDQTNAENIQDIKNRKIGYASEKDKNVNNPMPRQACWASQRQRSYQVRPIPGQYTLVLHAPHPAHLGRRGSRQREEHAQPDRLPQAARVLARLRRRRAPPSLALSCRKAAHYHLIRPRV